MATLKTAMVTGATGAIGEAIARSIAERQEFEVVLAVRDPDRGEAAAQRIRGATGNDAVRVELVDLASRRSIEALRERWSGPLAVLVNNAAVAPRRREVTDEGIERQLAVNVLGYVRMVDAFRDRLTGPGTRVVNVASYWAGDLVLDDLQFERRRYDNGTAYRQSKQANRMMTVVQAEALAGAGIAVSCCHPGDVSSTLSRALGFGGFETPDQAAETPAWLATLSEMPTGRYFSGCREERCSFAGDRGAVEALAERLQTIEHAARG